jgi:polysaccharide export outer membrane protein
MRIFCHSTSGIRHLRNCTLGICGLAFFSAAACAQTAPQAAGVTTGAFPDSMNAAAAPPTRTHASLPLSGGDSSVRLGAGDLVDVSVYNVPEMETKTRVSYTGDIYLPLVDYVHVDGLTVDEAENVIEKRLDQGGYVRSPHVQLFVQEYASSGVNLMGEVGKPGIYHALGEQTLFNMISAAGGFTDRAGSSITITRHDPSSPPITVPLSANLQEHPESNIPIYPGDTIMVRRADVIFVVGDVGHPSGLMMGDGGRLSVLQAVALAGGTTTTAKLSGTRIIRKGPAGLTEVPVPLKKLLQAKAEDIALEPNDILFVPSGRNVTHTAENALQMAATASILVIR